MKCQHLVYVYALADGSHEMSNLLSLKKYAVRKMMLQTLVF